MRVDGLTNVTSLTAYLGWINTQSSGVMGVGILSIIWVVLFGITLMKRSWSKSALFASTITILVALPLVVIGFVNQEFLLFFISLFGLSGLATFFFPE